MLYLFPKYFPHPKPEIKFRSYLMKIAMTLNIIISTITLVYFFLQHKFYCTEHAFSWFSLCEYFICVGVTCFHLTAKWDFYKKELVLASVVDDEKMK